MSSRARSAICPPLMGFLCGADEAAVEFFLSGVIDFGTMTDVVQVALDEARPQALEAMDQVLDAHREGIRLVRQQVADLT